MTAIPLNVLIVEDSPDDADLVLGQLRQSGYAPNWKRVQTEEAFLAEIKNKPDIILSDYSMPSFGGLRAAELLRKSGLEIPFILISGTVGEDNAVEAIKQGVTDYLLKDRITRLGASVQRALREVVERSERRLLESQFIEAQKMEVLGQLAGGVAHDFNNILAIIMGYSELAASHIGPDGPLRKYITEIRHASERAVGLTRQLLVFSRKQKVEAVLLDLNKEIDKIESMLRRLVDENIEMIITPGIPSGYIKADSGYLGQVLMNLVVNARDAMPNGGRISIASREIYLDQNQASNLSSCPMEDAVPTGKYVMLSVSDTGVGMTDEVKKRIFEAFFTTKGEGKGTGLGLATCHKIVQQSGGFIRVESELGKGTTFRIYFPGLQRTAVQEPVLVVHSDLLPCGSETLLVVEDDSSVRLLARTVLEARGYAVLTAANGQDALRVAREHNGSPIQLVVTDVIMPMMGGKVMAEWLKTLYPEIKVLFTSGYTDDMIISHGVLDEQVEFLPKPYTAGSLTHKVREFLDRPPLVGSKPEK